MKNLLMAFTLLFTTASNSMETNIERFMDQVDVPILTRISPIGELPGINKKTIKISRIDAFILGDKKTASGLLIEVVKSKNEKELGSSYLDESEVGPFISALNKIWSSTTEVKKNELVTISVRTKSKFYLTLMEASGIREIEASPIKRFVLVAVGDAYDELDDIKDVKDIKYIKGLVLIPMESIKDIVSIVKKAYH